MQKINTAVLMAINNSCMHKVSQEMINVKRRRAQITVGILIMLWLYRAVSVISKC